MGKKARKVRVKSGARFNLGEPWDGRLADFCAAHFMGSATDVVRAALEVFIPMELARDLATAERYHKLQSARTKSGSDEKDGES
jgi:hypothetical protein